MPVKRTFTKNRRWSGLSVESIERWKAVRPGAIQTASVGLVLDDALGDLVGWPALIAMPPGDAEALIEALEDGAARHAG